MKHIVTIKSLLAAAILSLGALASISIQAAEFRG